MDIDTFINILIIPNVMQRKKKRSERAVIYNQIVEVLKQGKLNVLQVSERTRINWQTVKNALETLEAIGMVKKEIRETKQIISLKSLN